MCIITSLQNLSHVTFYSYKYEPKKGEKAGVDLLTWHFKLLKVWNYNPSLHEQTAQSAREYTLSC